MGLLFLFAVQPVLALSEGEILFLKEFCDANKEYNQITPNLDFFCTGIQTIQKNSAFVIGFTLEGTFWETGQDAVFKNQDGLIIDATVPNQVNISVSKNHIHGLTINNSVSILPKSFENLKWLRWLWLDRRYPGGFKSDTIFKTGGDWLSEKNPIYKNLKTLYLDGILIKPISDPGQLLLGARDQYNTFKYYTREETDKMLLEKVNKENTQRDLLQKRHKLETQLIKETERLKKSILDMDSLYNIK